MRPQPDLFAAALEPITRDRARVLLELARMKPLLSHAYLEEGRGIPAPLLSSPRFAGKIKSDYRHNVIFPHADQDGPCGYEIKNKGFTGFAPGGEKGLWFSAASKEDTALVIAESGIDALSYARVFPDENARYASIGGAMNPGQPDLVSSAIRKMHQGAKVILAMDNDEAGRDLVGQIEALAQATGRTDLTIRRHLPEGEGEDWNDVLRAGCGAEAPVPAALP
jgi:phage/plasmid primase-like uncharacterized protein